MATRSVTSANKAPAKRPAAAKKAPAKRPAAPKKAAPTKAPAAKKSPPAKAPAKKAARPARRVIGPVERSVRADVAAIVSTNPVAKSLGAMAFELARTLDQGAGLAVAAVNRELRANLVELARMVAPDDDGLEEELSTPVRDAP